MKPLYLYADETGNLDLDGKVDARGGGASTYFGFGTALFEGDHGRRLLEGLHLRAAVTASGVRLNRGFHACDDSNKTRNQMFQLVRDQAPRIDATFLYKANIRPDVREKGEDYLYKIAWYLHFKFLAQYVIPQGAKVYVVVAEFGVKARRLAAEKALADVCRQFNLDMDLCVWPASTSWGLQVADYSLWALQRHHEGKKCSWFEPCIRPSARPVFFPWGRAEKE